MDRVEYAKNGKENLIKNLQYKRAHLIDPPVHSLSLEQLPGVGHQSDGVTEHDDDADVDTNSGHQHVLSANVTLNRFTDNRYDMISVSNPSLNEEISGMIPFDFPKLSR